MIQSYFTSLLSVKYLSLKFRESTAYSYAWEFFEGIYDFWLSESFTIFFIES